MSENILLAYGNKATGATLSGGQWESALPLDNLKNGRLGKVARSSNQGPAATQFRFDLGANYTLRALALVNHNLSTGALWRARTTDATLDMDFVGPTSMKPVTLTTSGGANGTRVGPEGNIEAATCPRYDYSPVNLSSGTATQTISSVPAGTYLLRPTGSNAAVMASGPTVSNSGTIGTWLGPTFVVVNATGNVTLTVLSAATAIHFRESLGLLVEEARTNVAVRSDGTAAQLDASGNASDAGTPITGFSNSIKIDLAGSSSFAYKTAAFADGTTVTASVVVQMDDDGAPNVTNTTASGDFCMVADGWVTLSEGVSAPTVQNFGGGRYRVSVQVVASIAGGGNAYYGIVKSTAQSARGFRVTGWQVEAGSFPTTYIPTTSAAVTRTADSVSITGSNFSGFFNATAGTFYAEATRLAGAVDSSRNVLEVSDGTSGNRIVDFLATPSGINGLYVASGSVDQVDMDVTGSVAGDTAFKTAFAYAANDFAIVRDAGTAATDVSGTVPTVSQVDLGQVPGGTLHLNGHIRRIAYWPTRRTNAELQSITTTGPDALGLDTGWQPAKQMTFHGDTPTNWGAQYPLIAAFDAVTARYGTVEIDDTANPDDYVELGQLFVAGGFQPTENAEQQGFADGRTDLSSSVKSVGGQKYSTARRRPRIVDFSFPMLTLEEGDHLDEMMAEVGTTEDVLYVPDPSDAAKTQRYGFLGTLRELSPLEYPLADKRAVPLRMEQKL